MRLHKIRVGSPCSTHHAFAPPVIVIQIRKRDGKLEVWTFILENEYDYYRKYLGLRGHAYNLNPNPAGPTAPPPQSVHHSSIPSNSIPSLF